MIPLRFIDTLSRDGEGWTEAPLWNPWYRIGQMLLEYSVAIVPYIVILLALEKIVVKDKSNETKSGAKGSIEHLSQFEFSVMLEIWSEIL